MSFDDREDPRIEMRTATLYLGQSRLPGRDGDVMVHYFRDLSRERTSMAIVMGDLSGSTPLMARVHSSCLTSECLHGRDCDCAQQLEGALDVMAREGEGVLFYLMQEGRGAGLTAKARDRMMVQASGNQMTTFEAYTEMGLPSDLRRYEVVAPMCRLLGIRRPIRLLTNNPVKAAAVAKVLADEEIEVCRTEPIVGPTSVFNSHYLRAKSDSGHGFAQPTRMIGASPPRAVRVVAPFAFPDDASRVLTASYFLPVALTKTLDDEAANFDADESVDWFRLSVIFDGKTARESVVLGHRDSKLGDVVAGVAEMSDGGAAEISMSLLDRLPQSNPSGRDRLREALVAISQSGRGAVRVSFDDRDCVER